MARILQLWAPDQAGRVVLRFCQSERTSAGLMESDLAWAPTHTLTNPFSEVVDHSAASSILAAGTG